jgi:hypothetical protein
MRRELKGKGAGRRPTVQGASESQKREAPFLRQDSLRYVNRLRDLNARTCGIRQ